MKYALWAVLSLSVALPALARRATSRGRSERAWTRRPKLGTVARHDAWRSRAAEMFPVGIWAEALRKIERPRSIDDMMKDYEGTADSASMRWTLGYLYPHLAPKGSSRSYDHKANGTADQSESHDEESVMQILRKYGDGSDTSVHPMTKEYLRMKRGIDF